MGSFAVKFDGATLAVCAALMLYKLGETAFSYIYARMLMDGSYTKIAVTHTAKALFPLAAFLLALLADLPLGIAILAMFAAYMLTFLLYDVRKMFRGFDRTFGKSDIFKILKACLPIMLSGLSLPFIHFITRYAVGQNFSPTILGSYSAMSMLLTAVGMIFGSVWTTFIVKISRQFREKDFGAIRRHIAVTFFVCLGLGAVVLPLGYWLSNPISVLIFGTEMLPFSHLLTPTLLAGGLLGVSAYFSTVLLAFGKRTQMLVVGFIGAAICAACVSPFINFLGLIGALAAIITAVTIQMSLSAGMVLRATKTS
jgi:O-antigen/teichoic acid export membrane protein